ncbi:MAG: polyprenyl synthetase family protein [Syntrophales bacterium]|nr:polyprenyl synthetase family protein [Syntrophales bacterium]
MQIKDVFALYHDDLHKVELCMEDALQSPVAMIPEIGSHLIGGGGKRFRPLLLLATSSLCGYDGEKRYPLSAVIEFIHTATLLHDDVIDHAQVRRGRVSANNVWGNAASVLVGDYLYSKAFKLMTEHGNLEIIDVMAETTNIMSEGEVFQLVKCGDIELKEEEYLSIIQRKTSYLISAACAVGAILGDAPGSHVDALQRFGMNVGSAFQIVDDTLDYVAREEEFGKAIGKDLDEGKITLPLIRTLNLCDDPERESVTKILKNTGRTSDDLALILSLINRYDGIRYAMDKAETFIDEGKSLLRAFPDSPHQAALTTIADYVLTRTT